MQRAPPSAKQPSLKDWQPFPKEVFDAELSATSKEAEQEATPAIQRRRLEKFVQLQDFEFMDQWSHNIRNAPQGKAVPEWSAPFEVWSISIEHIQEENPPIANNKMKVSHLKNGYPPFLAPKLN